MRTSLPDLDRPIAADHSSSIVVDVPFGIRGGVPLPGERGPPSTRTLLGAGDRGRPPAGRRVHLAHSGQHAGRDRAQTRSTRCCCSAQGGHSRTTAAQFTAGARPAPARWTSAGCWSGASNPPVLRALRLTGFRFGPTRPTGFWCTGQPTTCGPVARSGRWPPPRSGQPRWTGAEAAPSAAARPGTGPSPGGGTSATRPSAARPRIRPRSPEASPVRSSIGAARRGSGPAGSATRCQTTRRDPAALRGEIEPDVALVRLVPAAPDPALALQPGRQPAYRALLQPEQGAQLSLGDAARGHQLDQRPRLGRGQRRQRRARPPHPAGTVPLPRIRYRRTVSGHAIRPGLTTPRTWSPVAHGRIPRGPGTRSPGSPHGAAGPSSCTSSASSADKFT